MLADRDLIRLKNEVAASVAARCVGALQRDSNGSGKPNEGKEMAPSLRTVIQIPVDYLWDESGRVDAVRERLLSKAALLEMLRKYPVVFYVADIGSPMGQLGVDKCFDFWKSEVRAHQVDDPESGFQLEDFPGSYAYIASEWSGEIQTPIVLLEKYH